jgi:hypothetical protein
VKNKTPTLEEFLANIAERKFNLNIVDTPEYTEALRNKGRNRTPEKRELLRRIQLRVDKLKCTSE